MTSTFTYQLRERTCLTPINKIITWRNLLFKFFLFLKEKKTRSFYLTHSFYVIVADFVVLRLKVQTRETQRRDFHISVLNIKHKKWKRKVKEKV